MNDTMTAYVASRESAAAKEEGMFITIVVSSETSEALPARAPPPSSRTYMT